MHCIRTTDINRWFEESGGEELSQPGGKVVRAWRKPFIRKLAHHLKERTKGSELLSLGEWVRGAMNRITSTGITGMFIGLH